MHLFPGCVTYFSGSLLSTKCYTHLVDFCPAYFTQCRGVFLAALTVYKTLNGQKGSDCNNKVCEGVFQGLLQLGKCFSFLMLYTNVVSTDTNPLNDNKNPQKRVWSGYMHHSMWVMNLHMLIKLASTLTHYFDPFES